MATHDYVIANGTGAAVRSDLNDALAAIVSQNSSATAPATTYAYMRWADTTAGVMKMRNGANSAWITLYQLDGEYTTIAIENGTAAAPAFYFKDSGTDTGIYSPGADQVGISTGVTLRFSISTTATTSTLAVVHPLGAVGTPSVTFTGDLNTGVYSSGADALDFATGGTRRVGIASTGDVTVYGGNVTLNAQSDLRFADSDSSNWVAFQAPATVASNVTWTLPSTDGTSGQLLSTNGSGTLSWATDSGGAKIEVGNTKAEVTDTGSNGQFSVTTEGNERLRVASDGAVSIVVPGGTTLYPSFACRAWVNFDGTANTSLSGTYSQSGTTVTVTATSHGHIVGNAIYADITSGTGVDGTYTVATVTDANTFTYTAGTSLTTSGNVTLRRSTIRGSGNVSSITDNGTGDYTVNFASAMPDANYSVLGACSPSYGSNRTGSVVTSTDSTPTEVAPTTSAVRVLTVLQTAFAFDSKYVSVSIFR